jgi:8-oxo-dGTP diphosphatase
MMLVTAAILVRDSRVFIAKRKAHGRLPGKWEFPGGKVEAGETPEACLKRELEEELGIEATVGDCMGESIHRYDFGTVKILFYRAFWEGKGIVSRDHQEVKWISLDQLNEYDFAPADIPFVERLVCGQIGFDGATDESALPT